MWRKLAVDVRRIQSHCEVHCADFHEVVEREHGCVTCQRYHPFERPLSQLEWHRKQEKILDEALRTRENRLRSEAHDFDGQLTRLQIKLYRKAQNQALQKVRIAQSLADMMSRQLEDEVKAIHQLEKQKEVLEGVLFKQTQKLFQAREELIKAEGRELGVYVTTRGRRVILGKRQRSLSK
jgi:tRNA A37 N6-isopentenylltransferase MiaA